MFVKSSEEIVGRLFHKDRFGDALVPVGASTIHCGHFSDGEATVSIIADFSPSLATELIAGMMEWTGPRPLVIAIHGAVANAATWISVQRCLINDCDVRATDLPGHGTRRAESFDLQSVITDLTSEVVEAALQRRVFVAGDSLGGYLALAVAANAGASVAGVIAGGCTFPMRGGPALVARMSLAGDVITSEWPFAVLARLVAGPEVGAAIVERGFAPRMRGLTLRALLGRDVFADVAAIDVPVIFVDGAFDFPIVMYAAAFARAARRGRYRIVPNAGHGVGLTHPDAFADVIRSCLAQAEEASKL